MSTPNLTATDLLKQASETIDAYAAATDEANRKIAALQTESAQYKTDIAAIIPALKQAGMLPDDAAVTALTASPSGAAALLKLAADDRVKTFARLNALEAPAKTAAVLDQGSADTPPAKRATPLAGGSKTAALDASRQSLDELYARI